jgi:2-hydroxychromene-2-carboxylate isomerase
LQKGSEAAAGFMKKAFDPRALGAGFAAALGFSLTSVLDKAIESIAKFMTQFEEIKKIMKESALEVAEIYARAAFDAMSPQKQLVELEKQRLEIAQQLAVLRPKVADKVTTQTTIDPSFKVTTKTLRTPQGTIEQAAEVKKLSAAYAALEVAKSKIEQGIDLTNTNERVRENAEQNQRAMEQVAQAGDRTSRLSAANADAQNRSNQSIEEYHALIKSLRSPMEIYMEELDRITLFEEKHGMSVDDAAKAVGIAAAAYSSAIGPIEDMTSRLSAANEEANKTIPAMSQLAQISEDAGAMIAQGFEDAILSGQKLGEVVRSLGQDLVRLVFSQLITQPLAAGIGGAIKSAFGFRAMGGPVSAGSPYVVGEKGPELFVPSSSGSIVPNGAMGSSGGGSGGVTVNYNIAVGVSRAELVPILEQERRRLKAEIPDMVRRGGGYRAAFA